mmetsp:Transcript_88650/g.239864  ORF Transcript_88650/g.239864 Transcript_88650/m.239864 type:complete len:170 (+) Transcript_88650:481-990(+)
MRVASWVIQVSPSPAPSTPAGFRRAQPSTEPIQSRSYAATVSSSPVPSTAAGFRRAQPSTEPFLLPRRSLLLTAALAGHTGKGKGANHTAGQPKQSRSYSNSLVTTGTKILYQLSTVDEGNGWMCPSTSPASSPATAPWNPMRDPRLLTSAAATKPHRVWDLESEQQQL